MASVLIVTSHPDSVVRNNNPVVFGIDALTPLEVRHIVRDVVPLVAGRLGIVKFLENAAGFVDELLAVGPRGCHRPVALRWME